MVQPPGSRKRRAPVPPPAAPVKEELEEGFIDGNGLLKSVKAAPPQPQPPRDMTCDVLDEPSPLGLRLKKSTSFLDLIQTVLSQENPTAGLYVADNSISETPKKKEVKSAAFISGERLKASNFPANVLKIGTWEYISCYEGDLVAKCYFAKHKLVWEVLDDGLKSKIEIQWSDITALKIICPDNEQGTLDLVLARPPLFFKETDTQPRKHTQWQAASDFTNGQASLNRRHTLQCPSTLLSKNLEKLIQCDRRLYELIQQPELVLETPYFEPRRPIFETPNESKDCRSFNDLKYEHEKSLPKFNNPCSPCAFSSPSNEVGQQGFRVHAVSIGSCVADFQASCVSQEPKNSNRRNQLKKPGLRESMYVDDFADCMDEQSTLSNPALANNEEQSNEVLEDLVQYLFSDTQGLPASDDKCLSRVNSFCSLLEDNSVSLNMTKPESKASINIGVVELDSDYSDEEDEELKLAGLTEPPAISRKDSFGDLLLNLPRIASIPQFLFDIPEDFGK